MGVWMFNMVNDYITRAKGLSKSEKQKVNEIVTNAIRLTRTYITRTRKLGDDEPSQILSTTWQDASNKLKKFGDESLQSFAQMLEEKSKYWSDPNGYDVEELQRYGMMLTQVETKLKELTA
jgi:hypothetical protein